MFDLFQLQSGILLILTIGLFVVKGFALIDCVSRSESSIALAGSLEKKAWLIILGLGFAAHLMFWNPIGLLNLAGTVAALVYLAQVRSLQH